MANQNTVEYRASLDVNGIKSGAAQAAQALDDIGQAGAAAGAKAGQGLAQVQSSSQQLVNSNKAAAAATQQLSQANAAGAISAGQHAMAMRQLPMQITDVVTSLAGGMPIYMVAIQQGGQIRDSFNGFGNALRGVTSLISPTRLALGGLGVSAAAVALAYKQGSSEADGYHRALVMTGNTAGVTASQMSDMAKAVGDITGGQHAASQALTEITATSKVAGESLQQFTQMAVDLERYAGQPVKNTAAELAKLGDEPVKASIKLNEQYHYLTDSVYQQIKALEEQGRKDEAAALAQKTYASEMAERAATLKGQLGTLERAWQSLGSMATKAWNAMLNVGRAATLGEVRGQIEETTRELNGLLMGDAFASNGGGAAFGDGGKGTAARIDQLKRKLGELNAQAAPLEAEDATAQLKAQEQADNDAKIAARARLAEQRKNTRSRKDMRDEEIAQLKRDRDIVGMLQDEYETRLANINAKYKDPKGPKGGGGGGIKVSDNEMASMRAQLAAAQQYYTELTRLGAGASELNTAERESLKISEQLKLVTDAKTRARLQEKQALADTLAAQLRTNKGLDESYKAHQKSIDANNSEADALEQRARQQDAANAVYGKGKVAIEQMTLATLEHQLAEAESSDSFDPKYIQSLERKIAAQKHWAQALAETDQKRFDQHADQLLANAEEMAAAYADELRVASATGLERERIVAARQVELKYAKERQAVDRESLSDDEKQRRLARLAAAEQVESSAAVSKATSSYMAKASDDMNKSLTDALLRGFEAGKDGAKNLADTVRNMFNTMLLRPVISAVMTPVATAASGAVQSAMSSMGLGGTGSSSGLMGGLTDWSSWGDKGSKWLMDQGMSMVTKGMEGTGSALMSLGNTVQGVDQWFKTVPGMEGGIGSAAGYLGAVVALTQGNYGQAIGSAIGTYILPGIGTMIGGFLGGLLDDLGGGETRTGGQYGVAYNGQVANNRRGQTYTNDGQNYWSPNAAGNALVDGQAYLLEGGQRYANEGAIAQAVAGTAQTINTLLKQLGSAATVNGFWAGLETSDKDRGGVFAGGSLSNGAAFGESGKGDNYKGTLYEKWSTQSPDLETAIKNFELDLKQSTLQALQAATDIPKAISSQLAGANIEQLTEEQVNALLTAINATITGVGQLRTALDAMGMTYPLEQTFDFIAQLASLGGGFDAMGSSLSGFYQSYYSETERMQTLQESLVGALQRQGLAIDPALGETAKAQYRQAVQDALGAGNAELSAQLLGMASSFSQAADYAQKSADAVAKAAQEQADAAAKAQQSLRTSLIALEGKLGSGLGRQYQAEDAAQTLATLLAGTPMAQGAEQLAARILSATQSEVQEYFRAVWQQLDSTEARQQLVSVTDTILGLVQAEGTLQERTHSLAQSFASAAEAALSARTSAGSLLDRINSALGGDGPAYALKREQGLWASMATASYTQQIELASELTDSVLARMQTEKQSADKLQAIHQNLRDSIEATRVGALSPLTLGQKLKEAGDHFYAAVAKANAGDTDAAGQVTGLRQTYLELAQRYYAASDDYTAVFNATENAITGLAGQMQTDAQQQLAASQATVAQLQQLQSVAQAAFEQADRDYTTSSAALQQQAALLTSMDGGIASLADLLAGLPAELAAQLQPMVATSDQALIALMRGAQDANAGLMLGDLQAKGLASGASAGQVARVSGQLYSDADVATLLQSAKNNYPGYSIDQLAAIGQAQYGISRAQLDRVINGSHRDGLDRVPFDGYIGELHRDEMVLTQRQANDYRKLDMSGMERVMQSMASEIKTLRAQVVDLLGTVATVTSETGTRTAAELGRAVREVTMAGARPR